MDIYSLVAANTHSHVHHTPTNTRTEDRYYSAHAGLTRPSSRLLGSIAMTIGVVLVFGMALI